ncbi:hypothetical protein DPV78_004387 [Talaromyces pinophilus]|nr:hypothetical protein DPV78_004387 [Talaromyces pinophilus]
MHMVTASSTAEESEGMSQMGMWRWQPHSPAQVDTAIAGMDRLSASTEAQMPPESLSSAHRDKPFFTDEEVRTPRFKYIAPYLEVPHDTAAFSARQIFTGLPRSPDNTSENHYIPAVLIFASADSARTLPFNNKT